MSYLYTIHKHMTKFSGLLKFSQFILDQSCVSYFVLTTMTGTFECRIRFSATLPISIPYNPVFPRVPIITISIFSSSSYRINSYEGLPSSRTDFTLIPFPFLSFLYHLQPVVNSQPGAVRAIGCNRYFLIINLSHLKSSIKYFLGRSINHRN